VSELRNLDQHQRLESYHTGVADAFATHTLAYVLAGWLAVRLGGHGGYLGVSTHNFYQERSLVKVDPLARPPEA